MTKANTYDYFFLAKREIFEINIDYNKPGAKFKDDNSKLKNLAASCEESSTVRNSVYFRFAR